MSSKIDTDIKKNYVGNIYVYLLVASHRMHVWSCKSSQCKNGISIHPIYLAFPAILQLLSCASTYRVITIDPELHIIITLMPPYQTLCYGGARL